MKNKKNRSGSLVVRLGAVMVILAAAYFAVVLLMGDPDYEPAHSETYPPLPAMMHQDRPVIESIVPWHRIENLDIEEINRRLPDPIEVLILGEDINASGSDNYVVIHTDADLPDLHPVLRDAGYTHVFRDLAVYELVDDTLHPMLHIDSAAIRDGYGNLLIDQVPAASGYALVMDTYKNDALYDAPVKLLEVVMLSDQGREASDDIVIYWDPSEAAFKATNTFGAP